MSHYRFMTACNMNQQAGQVVFCFEFTWDAADGLPDVVLVDESRMVNFNETSKNNQPQ